MIQGFKDYDKTQVYGNFKSLPKGAYIIEIKDAKVKESDGNQRIELAFDIADGEYKGYYADNYKNQKDEDKKWKGIATLWVPKDDGTEQDEWSKRRFKTFTTALEDSNPGYRFDWDETKFKGKKVAGLFRYKDFEGDDGKPHRTLQLNSYCSIDDFKKGNYKLPKDYFKHGWTEDGDTSAPSVTDPAPADENGFMKVPEGVDDEIPFLKDE